MTQPLSADMLNSEIREEISKREEGLEWTSSRIGEKLKEIRNLRGLSLKEVEARSKGRFKSVTVGSYERGDRRPTVPQVDELLAFYGYGRIKIEMRPR